MQVQLHPKGKSTLACQTYRLEVKRGQDKKVYSDSQLFYRIKEMLNAIAMYKSYFKSPLIKKLMYKDGHMVSDTQYYLRSKKPTSPEKTYFMIYDTHYQVRNLYQDYNNNESVMLEITF